MSIIENLYNGKINPIEEAIPQDEKYRPLIMFATEVYRDEDYDLLIEE